MISIGSRNVVDQAARDATLAELKAQLKVIQDRIAAIMNEVTHEELLGALYVGIDRNTDQLLPAIATFQRSTAIEITDKIIDDIHVALETMMMTIRGIKYVQGREPYDDALVDYLQQYDALADQLKAGAVKGDTAVVPAVVPVVVPVANTVPDTANTTPTV
jgi:hypothetical protein